MDFFVPETLMQGGILLFCLLSVWTAFQLLPFKSRKQKGLVQYVVMLLLAYGLFLASQALFFSTQKDETVNTENTIVIENTAMIEKQQTKWQAMTVRERLHLRSCAGTHCDSLMVLESGVQLQVDINSNNNNWLKAKVDNQQGYVSSLWLER